MIARALAWLFAAFVYPFFRARLYLRDWATPNVVIDAVVAKSRFTDCSYCVALTYTNNLAEVWHWTTKRTMWVASGGERAPEAVAMRCEYEIFKLRQQQALPAKTTADTT